MTLPVPSERIGSTASRRASVVPFPVSRQGGAMSRRQRTVAVVVRVWVVLAAAGVLVGAAAPWVRSGAVRRSAFGLARTARAIGLVETGPQRVAVVMLFLTPMAVAALLLALSAGRHRLAGMLGGVVGLVALAAGWVGLRLPGALPVGPRVTLVAGAALLAGSAAEVWLARRRPTTEATA